MKKKILFNLFIGIGFIVFLTSAITNASGPGGGYTNAPNESSCVSCHGGSLVTSGSNWDRVNLKGNFVGNGYVPDSTYTMEVTFKQTGRSKFGFQVTSLNSANDPIGTFTNTNSRTSRVTASVNSKTREYIQHTSTGTANVGTDSTRWTFSWKAPNSNVGKISFYVVVMATDNNSTNNSGDIVYSKKFDIDPSNLLPKAQPTTNTSPLCTNNGIVFNGAGTNSPTSYSWRFINGTPTTSTLQNPSVSWGTTGQKLAILTVKNNLGTSAPDTVKVTLLQSPSASIANGASATICKGDSILVSANSVINTSYLWSPINKPTRTVYLKDSGNYRVRVTSNINGCSNFSPNFRLNVLDVPTISISNNKGTSFCGSFKDTFYAQGTNMDTILWYNNNQLIAKTSAKKLFITGNQSSAISAKAKSTTSCLSTVSNLININVVKKVYPSMISSSKTTSTIKLVWTKNQLITGTSYELNNSGNFINVSDSFVELSGLNPATSYQIKLRFSQNNVCQNADSVLNIKTNDCSNISYTLSSTNRVCKGSPLKVELKGLYLANYSVSFNNAAFGLDSSITFNPIKSDTLLIKIIDSSALNCLPIIEKFAYVVDTLFDNNSNPRNQSVCSNVYTYALPSGYSNYKFYKNGILSADGSSNSFEYTNLNDGDQLTAICKINTCEMNYGPVVMNVNESPNPAFTFSRNWYNYTFVATQSNLTSYTWSINNSVINNSNPQLIDLRPYAANSVNVVLKVRNSINCTDSSSQTINVPDFSSIDIQSASNFNTYPNPFKEVLNINSTGVLKSVKVLNSIGQLVFETKDNEEQSLKIDTKDWQKGIYFVYLESETEQIHFKVVKIE